MVDISGKIAQIKELIDAGSYFTINRGRQYGKTTTLYELNRRLSNEYLMVQISFEGLGDESFASPEEFCPTLVEQIVRALRNPSRTTAVEQEYIEKWENHKVVDFKSLSRHITEMCADKKIVLMIDEVDRTSHNRVFLNFIGMLREKFLSRKNGGEPTFHSVILAGVYDIKNIKLKLINEGMYTPSPIENKIYNSPWNIAVNFDVDMSFSPDDIATMLADYEADHKTGMNIAEISEEIYSCTSGYPFLVSRICQYIDLDLGKGWSLEAIAEAADMLLYEANTLFDDMFKNIRNYPELNDFIYELMLIGEEKTFNADQTAVNIGTMFGYFKNVGKKVKIANKIFETRIYNYYTDNLKIQRPLRGAMRYDVVKNSSFDMEYCMRKFSDFYQEIYNEHDLKFIERHGRLLFLSYLRPLINGDGFYHVESALLDQRRMDIVVDYGREQFIIELKIWRGEQYERDAYEQLAGYLEKKNADVGYLLTFDFRKESNKRGNAEWIEVGGKRLFEVIV